MVNIQRVVILGANGTMGAGSAEVFAAGGCDVVLLARSAEKAREGLVAAQNMAKSLRIADRMSVGTYDGDFDDAIAKADLIFEALAEDLELKKAVLRTRRHAPPAPTRSSPRCPRACRSRRWPRPQPRASGATSSASICSTRPTSSSAPRSSRTPRPTPTLVAGDRRACSRRRFGRVVIALRRPAGVRRQPRRLQGAQRSARSSPTTHGVGVHRLPRSVRTPAAPCRRWQPSISSAGTCTRQSSTTCTPTPRTRRTRRSRCRRTSRADRRRPPRQQDARARRLLSAHQGDGKQTVNLVLDPNSGGYTLTCRCTRRADRLRRADARAAPRRPLPRGDQGLRRRPTGPEADLARRVVLGYVSYALNRVGESEVVREPARRRSHHGLRLQLGAAERPGRRHRRRKRRSRLIEKAGLPVPQALATATADEPPLP